MKPITIFKTDLSKPTAAFLMWSPIPNMRPWFFSGVRTDNFKSICVHFLGFVFACNIAKAVR